jgi:hypothetical protein
MKKAPELSQSDREAGAKIQMLHQISLVTPPENSLGMIQ